MSVDAMTLPDPPERWTEVNFSTEGVGITLYEEDSNGVRVVDETWLTSTELDGAMHLGETVSLGR